MFVPTPNGCRIKTSAATGYLIEVLIRISNGPDNRRRDFVAIPGIGPSEKPGRPMDQLIEICLISMRFLPRIKAV